MWSIASTVLDTRGLFNNRSGTMAFGFGNESILLVCIPGLIYRVGPTEHAATTTD